MKSVRIYEFGVDDYLYAEFRRNWCGLASDDFSWVIRSNSQDFLQSQPPVKIGSVLIHWSPDSSDEEHPRFPEVILSSELSIGSIGFSAEIRNHSLFCPSQVHSDLRLFQQVEFESWFFWNHSPVLISGVRSWASELSVARWILFLSSKLVRRKRDSELSGVTSSGIHWDQHRHFGSRSDLF